MSEEHEDWIDAYQSALLELGPNKLPARIAEARFAVEQRLKELSRGNANETQFQALADALLNLQLLSRTEAGGR